MKKWLQNIFKWFHQVHYNSKEHKRFRGYVTNFYDHYDPGYGFSNYRITKIRLYDYRKKIVIQIHSIAPGMIIGKSGNTLDRFKSYMQTRYGKPIQVTLEETNPFK